MVCMVIIFGGLIAFGVKDYREGKLKELEDPWTFTYSFTFFLVVAGLLLSDWWKQE